MDDLKKRIVESGSYKLIDNYTSSEQAAQQAYLELDKIIRNVRILNKGSFPKYERHVQVKILFPVKKLFNM